MVVVSFLGAGAAEQEPAKVTGSWTVKVTFDNGNIRLLRFEAQESGKGSFLLLDPSLKVWGPATPSEAKWSQGEDGLITFSGPVAFPLGNVGRDPGTLILTGKLEGNGSLSGKAVLMPLDQDLQEGKPSKMGKFEATRGAGG
jgi:hypothetical protein